MNEQKQLEEIIARLEEMLRARQFQKVDELLQVYDPWMMPARVLLGILTITKPAAALLRYRTGFVMDTEEVLAELLGNARAEALLRNRR